MPANIINFFAKKTKKSSKDIESSWNKAKEIARKQYPKVSEKDDKFYQIVTGIMKKMHGIEEDGPAITTSNIGNMGPGQILGNPSTIPNKMKKVKYKPTIINDPAFMSGK